LTLKYCIAVPGLALLSVATIVCDIVVLYLMKNRDFYKRKKYLEVKAEDAFSVYRPLNDEVNVNEDHRSKTSDDAE
jgi:P2X purinoceptor 4